MSDVLDGVTLRQLRSLAAIDSTGSVTGAARVLRLTQPAVTLQIRGLQDLVGLPLLQRTNDRTALTEVGRNLLVLHQRIALAVGDCAASIDAIKGLSGGTVAVGAVSTAKYFVPFAIAGFSRRFPQIQIKLSIGNRKEILAALRDYTLDIAITGRPPEDMELERRLIGDHPHVVVAPPDHPLARRRKLAIGDLGRETFIVREPDSGTRLLMQRTFTDLGFDPKIGMEIDSNETIKQAVMAGLGVAFISAHTVANECHDGRLSALDVIGLPLMRQWFVVRRADKPLLPAAQAMLEFLGTDGSTFLPRG
jgi:DNA-binding transcriptional LysR family regulator